MYVYMFLYNIQYLYKCIYRYNYVQMCIYIYKIKIVFPAIVNTIILQIVNDRALANLFQMKNISSYF